MKKQLKEKAVFCPNKRWKPLLTKGFLFLWLIFSGMSVFAQNTQTIRGKVIEESAEPLPGVSVVLKNTTTGTITNADGNFTLTIPAGRQTLTFSFLGMKTQEVVVTGTSPINVVMKEDAKTLGEVEVVVVGFGTQKKESVVGAIAQTTGKVLERTGGVSDIGMALTGNIPGLITISSHGMPGEEDPKIIIRGLASWNNSDPFVLVDGIARPMSSVDINSVETISVLKDASATAIFGVRGANGVILITTKRGQEGKANINFNYSTTVKVPSKVPSKYDSYDALMIRNRVIESELGVMPDSWRNITPQSQIEKYRYPANTEEFERYPNVDWQKELFKDYALSHNANLNVSGGTKFVKYFANLDYQREGDLYREFDNNRGYTAGYGFDRLNVRSNLDFSLTKTTTFSARMSGSHGVKKGVGDPSMEYTVWLSLYGTAPDAMRPRYSDGTWGYYWPDPATQINQNSVETMAIKGISYTTTDRINTDFTLTQDLGMLLKGLKIKGILAYDNSYQEVNRGINDIYNTAMHKWIDPKTGTVYYDQKVDTNNEFDFQEGIKWNSRAGSISSGSVFRRIYYSAQIDYANSFGKHNVTVMGNVKREEYARGSVPPSYREDWVFRTTYDFDRRYLLEYNGSYNGSEKFAPENRFAYFQSGALGWLISEEPYIKKLNLNWLDMFKLRSSYGIIGDDQVGGTPWMYMDRWEFSGSTGQGDNQGTSPYTWYRETYLGNPNVQWETVTKFNFGTDFSFLNRLLSGSFEIFKDKRRDIFLSGEDRKSVPSYLGANPPAANIGAVDVNGMELELKFNKKIGELHLYGSFVYTHAKDKILVKDDPELYPDYRKQAGFANDQARYYVDAGYVNNWDELYGSTAHDEKNDMRIPGQYIILDYDADGVISKNDWIPCAYSGTPQNTFNTTIGADWKGWSFFVQFYGVTNVIRDVPYKSLDRRNTVFEEGSYWSKDNMNADVPLPFWLIYPNDYMTGTRFMYDGSYLRLKNIELAYTFTGKSQWIKAVGMNNLKLYVSGNNLWLYTKMPDDRESNFAGTHDSSPSQGAYPTVKRINCGLRISF